MGLESLAGAASGATPWGAIASAAGGLINLGVGLSQRRKGKNMLRDIGESPNESIPNEVLQNQKMAQLRANTGLPSEQYNAAMKNLQRNQMMALRAGQDRRGGLALVGSSQQGLDDSTLKLDVANANARMQNERTLYGINNQVGNWRDKVWQNNVKDVWDRKYQYGQSLLGSGNQNLTTGINQIAGGAALYGGSGGFGRNNRGNNVGNNLLRTDSSNYE
jgi:hypothetical protein